MTTPSSVRRSTMREALFASAALFCLFAFLTLGLNAQEAKKDKAPGKAREENVGEEFLRSSIELAGYTRPGTPPDKVSEDGKIIATAFGDANMKKFKILGATIYFAVFKNMGEEGDTFGTGMPHFDRRFDAGRSFKDAYSPRFDKKAKYLYLYQIVNDRFLNPHITEVKGANKEGQIRNPLFDPELKADVTASIPRTENIHQFALKLLVDPRFITSWGHFRDSGFTADVVDVDNSGKPVKEVVDDGKKKVERTRAIRLAFSYLPAITTKLPYPAYHEMAKPISLGDLEKGFGVGSSSLNLKESKAYNDLKQVAGQIGKDNVKWAAFVDRLIKSADARRDPDFVQVNYPTINPNDPNDPAIPGPDHRHFVDEVAYSTFRVTWLPGKSLKQGERSVLVGFTTDLPPVFAPVRTDNDKSAEVGKELQLSGGPFGADKLEQPKPHNPKEFFTAFHDTLVIDSAISFTQAGGEGSGSGSAYGTVPTPTPPPPPSDSGPGGAGITGGFSNLGGSSGGGAGGIAFPVFTTGFARQGGIGGGGGGGTGGGQGTPTQTQTGTQSGNPVVNFNATLINQQQQQQQQQQEQEQNQNQHQNNNRHGHRGHVVPAPASLLLGLLGLPGLLLLRRRKTAEQATETAKTLA